MYKVTYYTTPHESMVASKWFKTLTEATEFAIKRQSGNVLEIKWYESTEHLKK